MMRTCSFLALAALLTGCGAVPSVSYVEPTQTAEAAKVRVITNSNVFGDSLTANCMPKVLHKMAQSGRLSKYGRTYENYPQFPLQPTKLTDMPDRMAPEMISLAPTIRMAQGMYVEVATEYLVPTNAPFMVTTLGAAMGSYGSTNPVCPRQSKVFDLEAGSSYEVFVGMQPIQTPDGQQLFCALAVRKLLPIGRSGMSLPLTVEPKPAPREKCKT